MTDNNDNDNPFTDEQEEQDQGVIKTTPNICVECGWRIGPLKYTTTGDGQKHEVHYCGGCGIPIEQALPDEDTFARADERDSEELVDGSKLGQYDQRFKNGLQEVDMLIRALFIDLRDNHPKKPNTANEAYARGDINGLRETLSLLRRRLTYGHGKIDCHHCTEVIGTEPQQRAVKVTYGHVIATEGDWTDFEQGNGACHYYHYDCFEEALGDG